MSPPNVVLVTIDCLRYDRCGFAGHHRDTTPTLDSLVSESYVFNNAQAPGPRTSESVPGIHSGRLSADCAYTGELAFKSIPPDAETLATWLKSHGYETIATIANPQLSPVRNFDRGFDLFRNLRIARGGDRFEGIDRDEDTTGRSLVEKVGNRLLSLDETLPVDPSFAAFIAYRLYQLRTDWPTVDGADVVSTLLESLPSDRDTPFFAWTHLNDVHCPIHPGRAREGGLIHASDVAQFAADSKRTRHQLSPRYELMYDSIVRYVDAQVGRIVQALEERGQYKDTLFIVTADHGEALFDRGIYEHASGQEQQLYDGDRDYLYRELLNVPLLIRPPGGDEGARITAPFSLTWLHAAVADLLDLPRGEFKEFPQTRFDRTTDTVFADALTENGHTVAAVADTHKTITDSTTPERVDSERWYWFDRRDEGERVHQHPDEELIPAVKQRIVDPESISRLEDAISGSTKQQLANLGYR